MSALPRIAPGQIGQAKDIRVSPIQWTEAITTRSPTMAEAKTLGLAADDAHSAVWVKARRGYVRPGKIPCMCGSGQSTGHTGASWARLVGTGAG
jgi:hypothetical protein